MQSFNFYEFLKDATNPSLSFLQNNQPYDDVLHALADMFEKLYMRVQEIKVTNAIDVTGSSDFQKYLNTNDGTVVIDFILEHAALYLDTDHFKDTMARMIRLFEERQIGGEIPNLNEFVKNEIIPSFKFFTMNAGDLHKSKGVQGLIERIFEFYSPASSYEKMFDGVIEWDKKDPFNIRLERFSSYRVGVTNELLTSNYTSPQLTIHTYLEFTNHKLCFAGDKVFISKKEREDWWIIDNGCEGIYKVDDNYWAVWKGTDLLFYKDDIEIYDSSYNFVLPTPFTAYENVAYVPQVINTYDPLNQYQNHNLYFIDKLEGDEITVTSHVRVVEDLDVRITEDGDIRILEDPHILEYQYNLIRFYVDQVNELRIFQTVKVGLGISYDPISFSAYTGYPRILEYTSLDYIRIDLYNENTDEAYVFNTEDTKLVYSYVIKYQTKQPDGLGGFTYPINNMLIVARDGYNYLPTDDVGDFQGTSYTVMGQLADEISDKYILQERVMTSLLEEELKHSIASDQVEIETVFDVFVPTRKVIHEDDIYTFQGYWDASSDEDPMGIYKSHGDYKIVSTQGEYRLSGITFWGVNDYVVWNANFDRWEKNNDIANIKSEDKASYVIDRTLLALSKPEFDFRTTTDNSLTTPYEMSGGLFPIKLSDIPLDINSLDKIISSDTNSIETFGNDPFVLYSFKSASDRRTKVMVIPMDDFTQEVVVADLTRILKKYPYETTKATIYNVEFTDKHIIVYATDSKNTDMGSYAVVMENTGYNIPLDVRTNEMNMSYDVDLRDLTRKYQPYYRIEDDEGVEIFDEEVSAFKATLSRYTPINANKDSLAALIDMGYTDQLIVEADKPKIITVDFPLLNTSKTLKEQSNIKLQDDLYIKVVGDPTLVNCDCSRQREVLYVNDFEAMTIFYDIINRIPDPNISGVPDKVAIYKKGKSKDIYSQMQEACRWESSWFYYEYNSNDTLPMIVRTKIRLNLFDQYQHFVPWGANGSLRYNWDMHWKVQYIETMTDETLQNWVDAIDESVYKNSIEYDECNPVGQFYTTDLIDDGSTFPMILVDGDDTLPSLVPLEPQDPWDVYDIPAANISLT